MNEKKLIIWVVAHLIIASLVIQEMRKQGKTEGQAKFFGHLAGSVSGLVLSSTL